MSDKTILDIFNRELERLDATSKEGPLDMDQLKRLEILTRSLKQHTNQTVLAPKDNVLADLTSEDLLSLIEGLKNQDAESKKAKKRNGAQATEK